MFAKHATVLETKNLMSIPGIEGEGICRTDMYCHKCHKYFIAELDFDINGNHIIECAYCGHEHCRTIKNGKITEDRWSDRNNKPTIRARSVWKSNVIQAQTSSVAHFIRDRWLNRSDFNV